MNDRVNKDDLIKRVAAETGQSQALVTEVVDTTFEEIYKDSPEKTRFLDIGYYMWQ